MSWHREVLHRSGQVTEAKVHEFNTLALHEVQDCFWGQLCHYSSVSAVTNDNASLGAQGLARTVNINAV